MTTAKILRRKRDGMPFRVEECTTRQGEPWMCATHLGPSRRERRDAKFRPGVVVARLQRELDRAVVAHTKLRVKAAHSVVAALWTLGQRT